MISIVTPCYNSSKYLKETIDSVISQSMTTWEWIIVDDCSTDNSIEIIKSYSDPRIILIELEKNSGAAVARNRAIIEAKYRYLTFLDSDDLWEPTFLEEVIGYMIDNNLELAFTSYHRKNENLSISYSDFNVPKKVDFSRLLYNCPIPMLTTIYDTKRIGKVLISQSVGRREDYAMWLDILKKIPIAHGISTPLATYRIRKGSYSRNKLSVGIDQYLVYRKHLKFSVAESVYYTLFWAVNGFLKYRGI